MRYTRNYIDKKDIITNERLKKVMREKDISSRDLTWLVHMTEIQISNIICGKMNPSLVEATKIAEVLGSDVMFLFPYFLDIPEDMRQFMYVPHKRTRR